MDWQGVGRHPAAGADQHSVSGQARGAATRQRPGGEPGVALRTAADPWVLRRRGAEQVVGGDPWAAGSAGT